MTRIHYLMITITVIVLDIWTKWLVLQRLNLYESIPVIPGFFRFVRVHNTGAAFGIGADASSRLVPLLLNVGAIAVFIVVLVYALRTAVTDRMLQVGLHLVLGGAVGNLLDRYRFGYVVDFLDVYVGRHHWPAFNIADSAISVGIALLFLDMRKKPDAERVSTTSPDADRA